LIHHQLMSELRREWEEAYDTHIYEGARTAAAMLAQGPTYEYLRLARDAAVLPAGGFAGYLAVNWERTAAVGEALRIAGALVDPSAPMPTVEEIERLASLLTEYRGDEEFAYLLLTGLGPRRLLELTAQVATLTVVGADGGAGVSGQTVGAIQAGLAAALVTATHRRSPDGPRTKTEFALPPSWIGGLIEAGGRPLPMATYGGRLQPLELYGFHALGVLLSHGDYDSPFLARVGGALIDFERANGGSDVWTGVRPLNVRLNWISGDPVEPAAGYDPMIPLLKALSSDLEAAKQIFTSGSRTGSQEGYLRLDYLVTDREWPVDAVTLPPGVSPEHGETGVALLGQLLERVTAVDADERSYEIVEGIIRAVAADESAKGLPNDPSGAGRQISNKTNPFAVVDIVHDELRPHLGRVASRYIEDLHWLMAGKSGPADRLSAGQMRLDDVDVRDLTFFLAEIGKDPRARDEIFAAELVYADSLYRHYLDGWDGSSLEAVEHVEEKVTDPLTALLGAVDLGATEAIKQGYAEADAARNEALRARIFWMQLGGSMLGRNSPAGPAVSFLSQTVLDQLEEQWRHDSTGIANYYVGDLRHSGAMAVEDMIDIIVYEELTSQMTPERFIAHVASEDLLKIEDLFYPEPHPQAGSFIPPEEWGEEQWNAWTNYKSTLDGAFIDKPRTDAGDSYRAGVDKARRIMNGMSLQAEAESDD